MEFVITHYDLVSIFSGEINVAEKDRNIPNNEIAF
jgi:hypothetical protein